jgi:ADP-heptose:LPS heptosyltransferase
MPGGGEGEHKRWGIPQFCSLGKIILSNRPFARLVFVLGPGEIDFTEIIRKNFSEEECKILSNGSIADIVRTVKLSKLTIANDCGPSHLAQMIGGNYIGLWGWHKQDPVQRVRQWTVSGPRSTQIIAREGMDIKTITPEEVWAAAALYILP